MIPSVLDDLAYEVAERFPRAGVLGAGRDDAVIKMQRCRLSVVQNTEKKEVNEDGEKERRWRQGGRKKARVSRFDLGVVKKEETKDARWRA
jgi:hypothetical protein